MRAGGTALALALALAGCGTERWFLDPPPVVDASLDVRSGDDIDASDESPAKMCTSDFDCLELTLTPHCDMLSYLCAECLVHSDCTQPGLSLCTPITHKCVECLDAPQDTCGPGRICQSSQCFSSCADGGKCPASAPFCNSNQGRYVCAECLVSADCADAMAGGLCQPDKGTCGEIGLPPRNPPEAGNDGGLDSGDALEASLDSSLDASLSGDATDGAAESTP